MPLRGPRGPGHWREGGEPPGNHNQALEPGGSFRETGGVTCVLSHAWGDTPSEVGRAGRRRCTRSYCRSTGMFSK